MPLVTLNGSVLDKFALLGRYEHRHHFTQFHLVLFFAMSIGLILDIPKAMPCNEILLHSPKYISTRWGLQADSIKLGLQDRAVL